jgi:sporulation protein YlmC with PRC-barrel domain
MPRCRRREHAALLAPLRALAARRRFSLHGMRLAQSGRENMQAMAARVALRGTRIRSSLYLIHQEIKMKRIFVTAMMGILCLSAGMAPAQTTQTRPPATPSTPSTPSTPPATSTQTSPPTAGRATLGVTVVEMEAVLLGWSAKRDLLGKAVINDKRERIGKVEDLIITPVTDAKTPAATFAIIGVGGFLGIGRNDVAIPMEQLQVQNGQMVLPGATKDALKALPKFEYAKKR